MKLYKMLSLLLVLALLLCGCGTNPDTEETGTTAGTDSCTEESIPTPTGTPAEVDFSATDEDMFSDRDYEVGYDTDSAVSVRLQGDSVSCDSPDVTVSGTTVTITGEGTYLLSGTLNDGMIIVDAGESDKLQLVLDGVSVTSSTSAALYIPNADKVFVTLADGTENTLANGGSFTAIDDQNIDGAVFSRQDLTFNGSGSLTVTSPAGHGIVCKDDLVFTSGTYTVQSASHGLDVNDSVRLTNAAVTVDAGKDGIHTENTDDASLGFFYLSGGSLTVEAEGDGISAAVYAQIRGGTVNILAGGGSENGEAHSSDGFGGFMGGRPGGRSASSNTSSGDGSSMKGIKTEGSLLIAGGTLSIDSADDGLHANASLIINGGSITVASGDDGIHAGQTLTITAGNIHITECYEGLEALDIAVSGGNIRLTATDDGINAAGGTDSSGTGGRDNGMFGGGGPGGMFGGSSNGSVLISGSNLYINSSGDGIDANGTLEISGGYTVVVGPTQGDTATLDYDVSGIITGGTFIGTGASGMAQTFSDSENQGVIAVQVGTQAADTLIELKDADGNTVISYSPELSFGVVILSSPSIQKGVSYTIYVGEASGTFEAS